MKSENNKKQFHRFNKVLTGSDGIVYLMFVGRDSYTAKIQNSLTGTIFRNDASVNQAVKRLLKYRSEFLVFKKKYREKGKPGRAAEIYTANLDPIFITLKAFDINFDENELRLALERLAPANDSFPQYLLNIFEAPIVLRSPWHITLANYFNYIGDLLRRMKLQPIPNLKEQTDFMLPTDIAISKENVDSLLSKNAGMPKKLISMAVRMSLPSIGLNPQFKMHLSQTMTKLDTLQSDLQDALKFLYGLKECDDLAREMGLKNIYELPSEMKKMVSKLEDYRRQLENLDRKIKRVELQSKKDQET